MKIGALALAHESQRYVRGYPPKGAWYFIRPNVEISRLLRLNGGVDDIVYRDERIQPLGTGHEFDLRVVHVDFGQADSARELARHEGESSALLLFFGPEVTAWGNRAPTWARHRVTGNLLGIWDDVRAAAAAGRLDAVYQSPTEPRYFPALHGFEHRPEMNTRGQVMSFMLGCACPEWLKGHCAEHLYCGKRTLRRTREEIVGEVIDLPWKHIELLDEDVARDPDYYYDVFRTLWNYRRHWTVRAGDGLFRHPRLIRLLAKAGVKLVFLNETFLDGRIDAALTDPGLVKLLYRRVKFLQARKMLVGARVALRLDPAKPADFPGVAAVLRRLDLDFITTRFFITDDRGSTRRLPARYHPTLSPAEPGWVRNRFYAMGPIVDRLTRRPRRVGFYSTARYLLPQSMAYRQNFLEGIPSP